MAISLVLNPNKHVSVSKMYPLYLRVQIGTKRKLYSTGIKVEEIHVTPKGFLKPTHPDAGEYNPKLKKIIGQTMNGLATDPDFDVQNAINSILYETEGLALPVKKVKSDVIDSVVSYYWSYAKRCESGEILIKKTKQRYPKDCMMEFTSYIKRLIAFEEHVGKQFTFNDMTSDWGDSYITFLRETFTLGGKKGVGLAENSIHVTIGKLKTMLRKSISDKVNTNRDFEDITAPQTRESDNIILTKDEVKRILALDLSSNPKLQGEQERFGLAYDFCLRFSDSLRIDPSCIYFKGEQPMFRLMTEKTQKEITIPITKKSYALLQKENFSIRAYDIGTTNARLQKLAELAGMNDPITLTEFRNGDWVKTTYKRHEVITSHATRRSAATHLYQESKDLDLVRQFGGWKSLMMLQKYLKVDILDNAEKMLAMSQFNEK